MSRRMERVNASLRRELGALITKTLRDPRIAPLTSVTRVDCSADLGVARVYISAIGGQEQRAETVEALSSAEVFLRKSLRTRLRMRHIPRLSFRNDESYAAAIELEALIDEVARQDGESRRAGQKL